MMSAMFFPSAHLARISPLGLRRKVFRALNLATTRLSSQSNCWDTAPLASESRSMSRPAIGGRAGRGKERNASEKLGGGEERRRGRARGLTLVRALESVDVLHAHADDLGSLRSEFRIQRVEVVALDLASRRVRLWEEEDDAALALSVRNGRRAAAGGREGEGIDCSACSRFRRSNEIVSRGRRRVASILIVSLY